LERRFGELGFARASGLLPGEGEGRIRAANGLEERQLLAIGAVGIEVTPIELAKAYLRLARVDQGTATGAQKVVLAGLRSATDYGLARGASAEKISVAGKTGTASAENDPNTHAWFAGFAPAQKPEVVVVVFLERGRGSVEATGVARQIFEAYAEQRR
jgi:cell division protein FtsI/penicillin-binding protein 2